ncbi:MAB_1171c family putative transporter [Arthrobacter wenxiniae]|uniref:DUF6545 domain-containing protein n=1 Tax=Arthrobacter wenxiniae TaxID=2713570 RepID=A0A7Y7LZ36_9MICC|nr:MAB_1171c family putative transporter [Arthrobacter wenxiniae]NVM96130.1 hypothetical protein [Arthrobacter wenxiniae]
MQYLAAVILWTLAIFKLPKAKDIHSRHVFWAVFFAAVACTLYIPAVYSAVDAVLGGHNLTKLATLIAVMLGFWQFRTSILVAVSTDPRSCRRKVAIGRWVMATTGATAVVGFLASNPGVTNANLQPAYAGEPGMKLFLLSGSAFLVWACMDLMVTCLRSLRHLRSTSFRVGFLLIAVGCAASTLAITDRVLYGSISHGLHPATGFTRFLDSIYWTFEALAVLCIGFGLIFPSLRRPVNAFHQNVEARALLIKLRPAWKRATAAHQEVILRPSPFEVLTPLRPNARLHLHRRFIEIRDGEMRSGQSAVGLATDNALLDRAEALLSRR